MQMMSLININNSFIKLYPNYHLANNTGIIVAGKNHQWMLKFINKSVRNRIFAKTFPRAYLITKEKLQINNRET